LDPHFEQRLGTIVGIVGLVFAAVGFAGPLPEHTPNAIVLIIGGLAGLVVGVALYVHVRSLPPFSISHQHSTFEITQADGAESRCTKFIRFNCNIRDQREFVHRNIYADGPLTDFHWDGEGTIAGAPERMAGEWIVKIRRDPSWSTRGTHEGTLSYKIKDPFTNSTEWVAYVCDRQTDEARLTVKFPDSRRFKQGVGL
jgi:hypothetical protein